MHLQRHEQAAEQTCTWLCVLVYPELMLCTNLERFSARQLIVPSEVLGWCWQMLVIPEKHVKWKILSMDIFSWTNQGIGSSSKLLIQSCFQACGICPGIANKFKVKKKKILALGGKQYESENSLIPFFWVCGFLWRGSLQTWNGGWNEVKRIKIWYLKLVNFSTILLGCVLSFQQLFWNCLVYFVL